MAYIEGNGSCGDCYGQKVEYMSGYMPESWFSSLCQCTEQMRDYVMSPKPQGLEWIEGFKEAEKWWADQSSDQQKKFSEALEVDLHKITPPVMKRVMSMFLVVGHPK